MWVISSGTHHGESLVQDVYGSIEIPVVNSMTDRTFPPSYGKILSQRVPVAAAAAGLRAWEECRDFHERVAIPLSLVFKNASEMSPRSA